MVLKIIEATAAKPGTIILIDWEPYTVRSNDVSKTGKHGHAKCRIEATGVFDKKKKVIAVPGHERFDIPLVEKKKAQVLNVSEDKASVMDLESFETIDLPFPEELKEQLAPEKQIEYWSIEGNKVIMSVL